MVCPSDLLTLNVAYMGQPFVQLQAYGIDTLELDTAYLGQPFIAQPYYEDCEVIDPPEPEPEESTAQGYAMPWRKPRRDDDEAILLAAIL